YLVFHFFQQWLAVRAYGPHPFPIRTRSLSPTAPMVLRSRERGRVGHRRLLMANALVISRGRSFFHAPRRSAPAHVRMNLALRFDVRSTVAIAAGIVTGALFLRERRRRIVAERFAAAGLETLLNAIDANDPQTGAHARRVTAYALIIADAARLDIHRRKVVERVALFHDIGKIHEALFDIIHEDAHLTPAERRAIATHPKRGAEVLAPITPFYPDLAEGIL